MASKLVIMATHGPEDPERATIPFVLAVTAQASGAEALLGFQADGVLLLQKGKAEGVTFSGFAPLKELLDAYRDGGGQLFACGPCLQARHITAEDSIEGVTVVNAATFVKEFLEAKNVLVY
jgi:predicted peroxiredoxin